MIKSFLVVACALSLGASASAFAQKGAKKVKPARSLASQGMASHVSETPVPFPVMPPAPEKPETRLEHYMKFAHKIGTMKLTFPGPYGGYTIVHLPLKSIDKWGDTVLKDRAFLLDMTVSHDGTFLTPDTLKSITDLFPFEFTLPDNHYLHVKLAPSRAHEEMQNLDSTFMGVLGYGMLRSYVTAWDFKENTITFYPLYANVSMADKDPRTLQLPLIDDAHITYCHCPFPTIWFEATAKPLNPGHVQLAPHQPLSQIFSTALDDKTARILDREANVDSTTGERAKVGLTLGEFVIGGENLAGRSPKRCVDPLPPEFHDLSVSVLGTLGTDVLRTFEGMIIDPSRQKVTLVK